MLGVLPDSFKISVNGYGMVKETIAHVGEPDCGCKWWKKVGVNPNWAIPAEPDPIGGQLRFMDTVVTVTKSLTIQILSAVLA